MSDRPSDNLGGLDIAMVRRIDEACRRFEANWGQGRRPRVEDYLADIPEEGRPALRAELEALERELRQSEETVVRPGSGPSHAFRAPGLAGSCHGRRGPTIAPGSLLTIPIPGAPPASPHDQPTAVLGPEASATPGGSEPTRIRYFGDYEIVRELRAAAWASSSWPGR